MADLSSYGVLRGEVAHCSAFSLKNLADPSTEYLKATQLVLDVLKLDLVISQAITRVTRMIKSLP